MKTYKSTIEGTWVEILKVELTEEQKALMVSTNKEDKEAKVALAQSIKAQREGVVPENKTAELVAFYNTIKPVLKETDVYQLISADLSEADTFTGILNCRVNREHIQVRF
tara:strand:- start:1131 stop:1460 length:330 start_codon:yes stop_codon:yes gene_type:complete